MKNLSISKIVVATDFSEASNRAFSFSISLAQQLGCEAIAVYVKDADDLAIAMRHNLRVLRRDQSKLSGKINRFLDDEFQKLHASKQQKVRFVVVNGEPSKEVAKVAKKEKAGLIVTGTRSRSMIAGFFLGSTARNLIMHSTVPVITVK